MVSMKISHGLAKKLNFSAVLSASLAAKLFPIDDPLGVATALARSPDQLAAMQEAGWEIASHGLKWIEHKDMPEDEERRQIAEAMV